MKIHEFIAKHDVDNAFKEEQLVASVGSTTISGTAAGSYGKRPNRFQMMRCRKLRCSCIFVPRRWLAQKLCHA